MKKDTCGAFSGSVLLVEGNLCLRMGTLCASSVWVSPIVWTLVSTMHFSPTKLKKIELHASHRLLLHSRNWLMNV